MSWRESLRDKVGQAVGFSGLAGGEGSYGYLVTRVKYADGSDLADHVWLQSWPRGLGRLVYFSGEIEIRGTATVCGYTSGTLRHGFDYGYGLNDAHDVEFGVDGRWWTMSEIDEAKSHHMALIKEAEKVRRNARRRFLYGEAKKQKLEASTGVLFRKTERGWYE